MQDTDPPRATDQTDAFRGRVLSAVLIAAGIVVLMLLLWQLLDVLLLVFGAILVAVILHAIGDPIARATPISPAFALTVAALVLLGILGGAVWLFQSQIRGDVVTAFEAARGALPTVGAQIGVPDLPNYVEETMNRAVSSGLLGKVTTLGTTAIQIITGLLLVLFGGAYFAIDPMLYRAGLVALFPAGARDPVRRSLDAAGGALKLWLLGQLVAMVLTGD